MVRGEIPPDNRETKGPLVETIDLTAADTTPEQIQLVIDRLKELGLYRPGLLYRGFDGSDSEAVLGLHRDEETGERLLHAYTEDELFDPEERESVIDYAFDFEDPAVAIIDPSMYETTFIPTQYAAKPEADSSAGVIAIFHLEHHGPGGNR